MIKKAAILLLLAILFDTTLLIFVWANRIFLIGLNPFVGLVVLLLSLLIGIPLVIFAVKRLIRYCKGKLRFTPATLFVLAFFIFLIGSFINDLAFGPSTIYFQLHDTYFVIADTHVMIFLSLIFLA